MFFMGVDFAFMLVLPFEPRRYEYKLMPNFTIVSNSLPSGPFQ
jgi:hypothetical protein